MSIIGINNYREKSPIDYQNNRSKNLVYTKTKNISKEWMINLEKSDIDLLIEKSKEIISINSKRTIESNLIENLQSLLNKINPQDQNILNSPV